MTEPLVSLDKMLNLLICLFLGWLGLSHAACPRIVCYHTNWSQYRPNEGKFTPENIDPTLCTHINYAFAKLTNGQLAPFEWNDESADGVVGMYEKFHNLKQRNPSVKLLLSVGGWNMGTQPFTQMAGSPGTRKTFIDSAVAFLKKNHFDGLDLDWEYPANNGSPPPDRDHFTSLVQELRHAFDANGHFLLTAAVGAGQNVIDTGYNVPEIMKYLDWINLMTYDLHGSWEPHTGENSPLYALGSEKGADRNLNVQWAANHWAQKGAPKSKISVGVGTYGRSFTLSSATMNGLYALTTSPGAAGTYTREAGFLSYYEICKMKATGGVEHNDADQHVPYLVKGNQWVGFDNQASLKDKVRFIKSNGFGGVMIWALDLDDFSGTQCGQGKYPLLNAIHQECGNPTVGPVNPVTQRPNTHGPATHQPVTHQPATQAPVTQRPGGSGNLANFCHNQADGIHADPSSCHHFMECSNHQTFRIACGSGTAFNPRISTCDMAANVPSCH